MKPDLEALYRAALAEAEDNELRAVEWWARGSKGNFEWHRSARKALAAALARWPFPLTMGPDPVPLDVEHVRTAWERAGAITYGTADFLVELTRELNAVAAATPANPAGLRERLRTEAIPDEMEEIRVSQERLGNAGDAERTAAGRQELPCPICEGRGDPECRACWGVGTLPIVNLLDLLAASPSSEEPDR